MVLAPDYAHELPRYGHEVGLTNYIAGIKRFPFSSFYLSLERSFIAYSMITSLLHWTSLGSPSPKSA